MIDDMDNRYLLSVFLILSLLFVTPCIAEKSKGLFSGQILSIELDHLIADIPDTPGFLEGNEDVVADNPQNISAWINIGKSKLREGDWASAQEAYSRAIALDEANSDGWEGYLYSIASEGDVDLLIQKSSLILENEAVNSIGNRWLGYAYFISGNYPLALEYFLISASQDPSNDATWSNLAAVRVFLGQHERALEDSQKAVNLNPENALALNNMAAALVFLGRFEEGLAAAEDSLQYAPEYDMAWNNKGFALINLGRIEEGFEACDTATRLNPENSLAWNNKAMALIYLERYEEAYAAADRATILDPDDALAWNNKGAALYFLGELEKAVHSYEISLSIKGEDDMTWSNLGAAYVDLKREKEAAAAYQKALSINPDNTGARQNLELLQNSTEDAISLLDLQKPDESDWISEDISSIYTISHPPGWYLRDSDSYDENTTVLLSDDYPEEFIIAAVIENPIGQQYQEKLLTTMMDHFFESSGYSKIPGTTEISDTLISTMGLMDKEMVVLVMIASTDDAYMNVVGYYPTITRAEKGKPLLEKIIGSIELL